MFATVHNLAAAQRHQVLRNVSLRYVQQFLNVRYTLWPVGQSLDDGQPGRMTQEA